MSSKKDKPAGSKDRASHESGSNAANKSTTRKKTLAKGDTDTEPDEFIAPEADTDQPVDRQVTNDAVLRGEPHAAENPLNQPVEDNNTHDDDNAPKKMDAGN